MKDIAKKTPTLIVLNNANGYVIEIANQLKTWETLDWSIYRSKDADIEYSVFKGFGPTFNWNKKDSAFSLNHFKQVLYPFLDSATLAEIANGLSMTPQAQIFQTALMKSMPVYALDYQCNLSSELNELLGLSGNEKMRALVNEQISTITNLGATVGPLSSIREMLLHPTGERMTKERSTPSHKSKYITVSDLKKGTSPSEGILTALAIEYINENKKA
ncbi:hypothetical protein I3271_09090 [Photobacterium leiognathi]|uniref:hypothetical protein n=1 Tax=Photobacterium leiognathi TaxID=553611 RepID=UPI001EDD0124|nr:hypothetical protein [Photobacterium leiognathi]MCG3884843.1 hypothetical protein [Photobacterium leiognathi]